MDRRLYITDKPEYMKKQIFKTILFLLLPGLLSSLSAQNLPVHGKFYKEPLSVVLNHIADQGKVKMAFDHDLAGNIIVTVDFDGLLPEKALERSLKGTRLWYITINEVFIIKPEAEISVSTAEEVNEKREYTIGGLVRERFTGEHLPYAVLLMEKTERGTISNSDGFFTLLTDNDDSLSLLIRYIGFETKRIVLHPPSVSGMVIVELTRQYDSLEQVEIIGQRVPEIVHSERVAGKLALNAFRFNQVPSLNNLDVATPIQLLPGIDGTTEKSSGMNIRKYPSDKNLILYDGFPVYHIDHFFGIITAFNTKAIKDIRLHKGGSDASYGGRTGGVIEITGKSGNMAKFSADAGADLLSGNLLIETPAGKNSSLIITGRRSFTDIFRTSLYNSLFQKITYDIDNVQQNSPSFFDGDGEQVFYFYDLTGKLTWKPTVKDVISLSGYTGYDNMDYDDRQPDIRTTENSNWGNQGFSLRWARQWSERLYHNMVVGYSGYHLYYFHGDSLTRTRMEPVRTVTIRRELELDNKVDDLVLNLNNRWQISPKNNLGFGLAFNSIKTDYSDSYGYYANNTAFTDTIRRENNNANLAAFYLHNTYSGNRISHLNYGLRISRYSLTDEMFYEPRLSVAYDLLNSLTLKSYYGKHHQFINRISMFEQGEFRLLWALSNGTRLPVVQSDQYSGGLIWSPVRHFSLDFELYHHKSSGMVAVQNRLQRKSPDEIDWRRVYYHYNNRTTGSDLLIKTIFGPAQFWLAYTFSKSLNQSEKVNRGDEYPAIDDQLHEIKLFGTFNKRDWTFSATWIYGSGKPYDRPFFSGGLQLSPDYEKNSERLPPYHRMDTGISKNFRFRTSALTVGVNIFNLYDRSNTLSRPYVLSEEPFIDLLQGRHPLIFNEIGSRRFAINIYADFRF